MKEIIKWDAKYLTGIKIIDSQHIKIFKCVNELHEALEKADTKEKIIELTANLDFYTAEHFDTEEKYMLEFNYPEYTEHKNTHERFKKIYEDIKNNYIYKKTEAVYIIAIHLKPVMAAWLDYHLQNEDRWLVEFLKSKNIENKNE